MRGGNVSCFLRCDVPEIHISLSQHDTVSLLLYRLALNGYTKYLGWNLESVPINQAQKASW